MSTRVNKYRCYCQTESTYVYTWDESAPTTCPNNNAHTIDTNMTTIMETISTQNVFVSKDTKGAGKGYYMYEGDKFEIAYGPNEFTKVFPFDVRIFGFQFNAAPENLKDKVDVIISPNTIIGVLLVDCTVGATTAVVSPTVFQYADVGHHLKLTNGVDVVNDLGMLIAKDAANMTVTFTQPLTHDFTGMATYVLLNLYIVKNLWILSEGIYSAGYGTGDSKIIPANTPIQMIYTCMDSNASPHDFAFQYEYTY